MSLDQELEVRLRALSEQGLRRELRRVDSAQGTQIQVSGKTLLNFSSNDYLGLANHPALREAAVKAIERFGVGSGASRLICGSLAPHHELEEALAAFKGAQAALTFSSGYAAAVGTICALLGKDDIIILDKLVHACIVDAARLSGAKIRVFKHNDVEDLKRILKWADGTQIAERRMGHKAHTLIVTESVFSMDGDHAPLPEIIALKEGYGVWLMVDEAHATGLYGAHRRGLAEELDVSDLIEVQMGTLGKALGTSGGYVCGSRTLIDYLVNRARSFIFSTAPVPAAAAAATAALRLLQQAEGKMLQRTLWNHIGLFQKINCLLPFPQSAIQPIRIGDEAKAMSVAAELQARGIYVPAIRYPTVAVRAARLRVTLTAAHSQAEVADLAATLTLLSSQLSTLRDA